MRIQSVQPPAALPSGRNAPAKFTLGTAELAAVLARKDSTAVQYVSRPKGSLLVALAGHHFEFVCNKGGAHYYRCVEHKAAMRACDACIVVKGLRVFAIRTQHSHDVVPLMK